MLYKAIVFGSNITPAFYNQTIIETAAVRMTRRQLRSYFNHIEDKSKIIL